MNDETYTAGQYETMAAHIESRQPAMPEVNLNVAARMLRQAARMVRERDIRIGAPRWPGDESGLPPPDDWNRHKENNLHLLSTECLAGRSFESFAANFSTEKAVLDGWNEALREARKRIHAMALQNSWGTDSDAYAVSCLLEDMFDAARGD
jgi:hypothetical protein